MKTSSTRRRWSSNGWRYMAVSWVVGNGVFTAMIMSCNGNYSVWNASIRLLESKINIKFQIERTNKSKLKQITGMDRAMDKNVFWYWTKWWRHRAKNKKKSEEPPLLYQVKGKRKHAWGNGMINLSIYIACKKIDKYNELIKLKENIS